MHNRCFPDDLGCIEHKNYRNLTYKLASYFWGICLFHAMSMFDHLNFLSVVNLGPPKPRTDQWYSKTPANIP